MVGVNATERVSESAAGAAVRRCLDENAAMTLEQLVARSGVPALAMARSLRRMGAGGQIEILRPLSGSTDRWKGGTNKRRVFYRLVRAHDSEYAWQQWVTAPLPVCRFRDWSRDAEQACGVW